MAVAKRKLRIAQIAPLVERIPPKKYGGTERVVWALTEELVSKGHEVTLFASGDSLTSAKLFSVFPRSLREAKVRDIYGSNELTMLNIGSAYGMQNDFDIIHDHLSPLSIGTANLATCPTVMTLHGAFNPLSQRLFETFRRPHLVAISNDQQKSAPHLNYSRVVYNGLYMNDFPFYGKNDGYLLFVGRISIDKGVHLAIECAQDLDIPLIIAAKLDDVDKPYFEQYVAPKLSNGQVKWIGEVDNEQRNELMSKALCLLHPITWREPFGLVMIEAMACGCPVIALNKGSVPEIVVNAKTGYIAEDVSGMINAIKSVDKINRKTCRDYVLGKFNARRMADEYEEVYYKIIKG